MKNLVHLCCLLATISAADLQQVSDLMQEEFNAFKLQYNKTYASEAEEQTRLQNFLHSRQEVAAHNARYAQGLVGYRLGINEFSDVTHEDNPERVNVVMFIPPMHASVAKDVDWRKRGAVTPVKNQRYCGSCWAFSSVGSLEGQHFRKTGELVPLSEQNLVDCSTMYGTRGCKGGTDVFAYMYIKDNGGIVTEASYPYNPHESWCIYNSTNSGANVTGFVLINPGDEDLLMLAVATVGPVAVSIDASPPTFIRYSGEGIYYDEKCNNTSFNHGVLVVGYGAEEGGDYWLIKNSWGSSWGMGGYMKLARNRQNHCGVTLRATYPLV